MNERLTELYRSCRPKEALASQDEYKSANALLGSEVEKFAELLIKECADYVQFYYKDHACEVIARDMKTHFGVE